MAEKPYISSTLKIIDGVMRGAWTFGMIDWPILILYNEGKDRKTAISIP